MISETSVAIIGGASIIGLAIIFATQRLNLHIMIASALVARRINRIVEEQEEDARNTLRECDELAAKITRSGVME